MKTALLIGAAAILYCGAAYAQNVDEIVQVPPNTRLVIIENGQTVMDKSVLPGEARITITYLNQVPKTLAPSVRHRYIPRAPY